MRIYTEHTFSRHCACRNVSIHDSDVIMSTMVSQITGISIVCPTVCSGENQRKHQSSAYRWIPLAKDQWRGKCFHLMTAHCLTKEHRLYQCTKITQNNTTTHIHTRTMTMIIVISTINAMSVITTYVNKITQAQNSMTWNYNMLTRMTSPCLYNIIYNISATILD